MTTEESQSSQTTYDMVSYADPEPSVVSISSDTSIVTQPGTQRFPPVPPQPDQVVPAQSNSRGRQCRCWVFTCNNFTEAQFEAYSTAVSKQLCEFVGFGIERGEQGTPHLQGVIQFRGRSFITACQRIVREAHYESMRGTLQQAIDYCRKDGHYQQFGEPSGLNVALGKQGARNELQEALDGAKDMHELAQKFPLVCIKFARGFQTTFSLRRECTEKVKPYVVWLAGPTGCGKTRLAVQSAKAVGTFWLTAEGLKWFDGYEGQHTAIIDDFRAGDCTFNFFLRILDMNILRVPTKGGFTWWNPGVIFITCPRIPNAEFVNHQNGQVFEDVEQVNRRCDEIRRWSIELNTWVFVKGAPMHE